MHYHDIMATDIASQIPSWDTKELWDNFSMLYMDIENDDTMKNNFERVRSGKDSPIEFPIDIIDIIQHEENTIQPDPIHENPITDTMVYRGKYKISLFDYRTEVMKRRAIMRRELYSMFTNEKFSSWME